MDVRTPQVAMNSPDRHCRCRGIPQNQAAIPAGLFRGTAGTQEPPRTEPGRGPPRYNPTHTTPYRNGPWNGVGGSDCYQRAARALRCKSTTTSLVSSDPPTLSEAQVAGLVAPRLRPFCVLWPRCCVIGRSTHSCRVGREARPVTSMYHPSEIDHRCNRQRSIGIGRPRVTRTPNSLPSASCCALVPRQRAI